MTVIFPIMAALAKKYGTSADVATLTLIVFDAAAMLSVKTIAGGLLCTERPYPANQTVMVGASDWSTAGTNGSYVPVYFDFHNGPFFRLDDNGGQLDSYGKASLPANWSASPNETVTLEVSLEGQFLDAVPDDQPMKCWTPEHSPVLALALIALPLYYTQSIYYNRVYQAKTTVVVYDQLFQMIVAQLKFFLAVTAASPIGTCGQAWILLSFSWLVTMAMLLLTAFMRPCNVRILDHVRIVGLANTLFALAISTHLVWLVGEHKCGEEIDAEQSDSWHAQALAIGSPACVFLGVLYVVIQRRMDKSQEKANLRGLDSIQEQFAELPDISYGAINQYAAAIVREMELKDDTTEATAAVKNIYANPLSPAKDGNPRELPSESRICMDVDLARLPATYTGQLEGPTWELLLDVPADVVIRGLDTESEGCQALIGTVQAGLMDIIKQKLHLTSSEGSAADEEQQDEDDSSDDITMTLYLLVTGFGKGTQKVLETTRPSNRTSESKIEFSLTCSGLLTADTLKILTDTIDDNEAIIEIDVSNNLMTGGNMLYNSMSGVSDRCGPGTDITHTEILSQSLQGSNSVTDLTLMNCGLTSTAVEVIAEAVLKMSNLRFINLFRNDGMDDAGLHKLMEAVETSSVQTVSGLKENAEVANYSELGLSSMDAKIVAADIKLARFSKGLKSISMRSTGDRNKATTYVLKKDSTDVKLKK